MTAAVAAIRSDATLDSTVETLRFLSDRNRLRILGMLMHSETCVCELIDELDLPQPLVSYHLRKLRDAGLVRARRKAQWIYYSIDPEGWQSVVAPLQGLFGPLDLPVEAHYGASNRCDGMPNPEAIGQ
jgi:DNA-binding transcriptional ArsR family regulator